MESTPSAAATGVYAVVTLLSRGYQALENAFSSKFWKVKLVLTAVALTLVMQCPRYSYLYRYAVAGTETNTIYEAFKAQVTEPLRGRVYNPASHESKMAFRLLPPLLVKLLHLPPISIFLLQFAAGIALYLLLIAVVERTARDRVVTVLTILGLSCTYYGTSFTFDLLPAFDTFAYALIMGMFYTRRWYALAALSFLGAFTDERTLVMLPVVLLWHAFQQPITFEVSWSQMLARFRSYQTLGLVVGPVVYLAVRALLAHQSGLLTYSGAVGLSALAHNAFQGVIGIGFLSALESFWLYLLAALLLFGANNAFKVPLLLLAAMLPIVLGAFLVDDITRSMAYGMPLFLVCLRLIQPCLPVRYLRNMAAFVMVCAIAIPTMYILGRFVAAYSIFNYLLLALHIS